MATRIAIGDISKMQTHCHSDDLAIMSRAERRRQSARNIVKAAGFPLWRKLVDNTLAMLDAGHSERFAAILLTKTTARLPQAPQ